MMAHREIVRNYIDAIQGTLLQLKIPVRNQIKDLTKPYILGFFFIRDSRRHFDYHNAHQLILDQMVKAGYFDDDDADNIVAVPLGYLVDPQNAGTYMAILPNSFYRSVTNEL